MASKNYSEALERRIRPIYDALDARNWKNALKLSNTTLEKYPDCALVIALKAIALQRSGKVPEADKLCDDIIAKGMPDDKTMHPLMIVLKDLGRLPDITRLYEAAVHKEPGDLEALKGLFGGYVREFAFAKQQQVAMKLSKALGGDRHLWWVVLSIMLQARAALSGSVPAAMDPAKLLQLAESMVGRQAAKEGRLEGYEALLVYLDLLLAQGKTQEALNLVSGPLGDVASMSAERNHLRAVLSLMVGDLEAAAQLLEGLLLQNPDDWASLQLYMDCLLGPLQQQQAAAGGRTGRAGSVWPESSLLHLSGGLAEVMSPVAGQAVGSRQQKQKQLQAARQRANSTVEKLVAQVESPAAEQQGSRLTMRGPYIARVELVQRCVAVGLEPERALGQALLAHIQSQGHLVSCAADVRPYTSKLGSETAAWLAEQLQPLAQSFSSSGSSAAEGGKAATQALRRAVCAQQVIADLGHPVLLGGGPAAVQHAAALMSRYAAAQLLYAGLDERERGPADELPVLAAGALMAAAGGASSDAEAGVYMLQALLLLLSCVKGRPYSAGIRLGLSALYTLMGCPTPAYLQCDALDMKNIQMDTLCGHHLLPALLGFAPSVALQLRTLLWQTLNLYNDHAKDAGETLHKAYQGGTYSKVLEFVAFRERLDAAHTRAVARAEKCMSDIREASQQGTEQTLASLSSACKALPLAELPRLASSSSSSNGSSSNTASCPSHGGLRFNEDLSTRPAWYPPSTSAPALAPACWWQQRSSLPGHSHSRTWWAATSSAEGPAPEAAEFRQARQDAARRRWLLPHLLSAALAPAGPAAADAPSTSGTTATADGLLDQYLAALSPGCRQAGLDQASCTSVLAAAAALQKAAKALQQQQAGSLVQVELLEAGVVLAADCGRAATQALAAAEATQAAATADNGSSWQRSLEEVAVAVEALGALLAALCGALEQALRGATASGSSGAAAATAGLLATLGLSLNLVSVLVSEHLVWILLLQEAWSRVARGGSRKKKGRAAAGTAAAPGGLEDGQAVLQQHATALREAVAAACNSLAAGLEEVVKVAGAEHGQGRAAAALQALQAAVDAASGSGGLWMWDGAQQEQRVAAAKAMAGLMEEQGKVAAKLLEGVQRHRKAAAGAAAGSA